MKKKKLGTANCGVFGNELSAREPLMRKCEKSTWRVRDDRKCAFMSKNANDIEFANFRLRRRNRSFENLRPFWEPLRRISSKIVPVGVIYAVIESVRCLM